MRRVLVDEASGAVSLSAEPELLAFIDPVPEPALSLRIHAREYVVDTGIVLVELGYADRTELWVAAGSMSVGDPNLLLASSTAAAGVSLQPTALRLGQDDLLVAYRLPEPGVPGRGDVRLVRTGSFLGIFGGPGVVSGDAGSLPGLDERAPCLTRLDDEVVLTYAREVAPGAALGGGGFELVYRSYVELDETAFPWPLAEPEQTAPGAPWISAAAVARRSGAGAATLLAYQADALALPPTSEVRVAAFGAQGSGGAAADLGGGCGGGGTLTAVGAVALGNDDFKFELTGLDPGITVAVFNLNSISATISCGGCEAMPWLFPTVRPVAGGAATWATPIADEPNLIGAQLGVQASSFYSPTENCPLLSFAAWSNRLELTFGL